MMQVTDGFNIKCSKCGNIIYVDTDCLDCSTEVYDRPMGEEIEYSFCGEIDCEKCHSWISFTITGFEYPIGAYNYSYCDCQGGSFVSTPTVEIMYESDYEFDDNYSDYAYTEFLAAEYELEQHRKQIENMSPRDFELFVGNIFTKFGYSVKITPQTRDGGQDIIATKADPIPFTLIIECKHWGMNHKVDVSVVRGVFGVQTAMQANQSVIVTSSKFTKDAKKFAEDRKNLMALWDVDDLLKLVMNDYN